MAQELAQAPRPVGRPKLPETIITELKAQVAALEAQANNENKTYEDLKKLAEIIRIVQRAVKGLDPNEDIYQGLIDVHDIRERTRLDETAVLSHSAMRTAAQTWPELKLFAGIADMEDPYYIAQDGEGRKEAILQQQAKTKMDSNNLVLNMPNTQGGPAQDPNNPTPPKKQGFFNKILGKVPRP